MEKLSLKIGFDESIYELFFISLIDYYQVKMNIKNGLINNLFELERYTYKIEVIK